MLSSPGDLPDFRCFRAVFIYSGENSPERLQSTLGALRSLCTLLVVCLAKVLSAFGNRPFLTSVVAMEFAVMGHGGYVFILPVSLLMVCHARLLE